MNRKHKIIPGIFYHVYNRGNDRQFLFRDDNDYLHAVNRLAGALKSFAVFIGAYCLMPNHYHLILRQTEVGSVSRLMQSWCTSIAKRRNLKYTAVGHAFQDKYKASPLLSAFNVVEKCRYVHLNPVAARLVRRPDQWRWSNYSSFTGMKQRTSGSNSTPNSLITATLVEEIVSVVGGSAGYIAYVEGLSLKSDV